MVNTKWTINSMKILFGFSENFGKRTINQYYRHYADTTAVCHSKDNILSRLYCSVTDRKIDIILFVFGTNGTVN